MRARRGGVEHDLDITVIGQLAETIDALMIQALDGQAWASTS